MILTDPTSTFFLCLFSQIFKISNLNDMNIVENQFKICKHRIHGNQLLNSDMPRKEAKRAWKFIWEKIKPIYK